MIDTTLKQAIDEKKLIEVDYEGRRIVEPYIIYLSNTGKYLIDCFQLEGSSKSGKSYGWKIFDINKLKILSILEDNFEIRREYNPLNRERYSKIIYKM
ncbi:MAG: hypothetical protein ACFFCS_06370 [Candidatus Hodarchaeota archaeon]